MSLIMDVKMTYIVLGLLLFVSLLVCCSLCLVWLSLLLTKSLPLITEDLADLTFKKVSSVDEGDER